MSAAHQHESHDHSHEVSERRLAVVFVITLTYMVIEVVGGIMFNSLALLADGGHMLSDVMALGLSWVAIRIGRRSATDRHTFGFRRYEILAALLNGLALWLIVAFIFYEAIGRFSAPQPVVGEGMLLVAGIGLAVNILMAALLFSSRESNLNLKGAFLHIVSDAAGSVGAIVAAVVILYTGRYWVDPLVSVLVGVLILYSSWSLIRESVHVLAEGTPENFNLTEIEQAMLTQDGVCCIHDLHVWTISGDNPTLTAHVVLCGGDRDQIFQGLVNLLRERFGITHSTIQVEISHDTLPECAERSCREGTACSLNTNEQPKK